MQMVIANDNHVAVHILLGGTHDSFDDVGAQ